MKKLVALLFVITISTLCLLAFSACAPAGKTNDTPTENDTLQAIYGTYVVFAEGNGTTPLSYEEWLESVKGKDGADGASVTKAEINNDGSFPRPLPDSGSAGTGSGWYPGTRRS